MKEEVISMLERNRLNPGDFIVPIPIGIPIKLVYNSSGVLACSMLKLPIEDVDMSTLEVSGDEVSPRVYDAIMECGMIPKSIPIHGGSTIICGVATLKSYRKVEGMYPYAVFDFIKSNNFEVDAFHAFYAMSYASTFTNHYAILNWLSICKFSNLSGFLLPHADMSKFESYQQTALEKKTDIKSVMGYMVFNNTQKRMIKTCLCQGIVASVSEYLNSNGVFMSDIKLLDCVEMTVPFATAKKYRIMQNSVVVYNMVDDEPNIIEATLPVKLFQKLINYSERRCSVCGRLVNVDQPIVRCDSEFCMSRQYNDYKHMMSALRQPYLTFSNYIQAVMQFEISSIVEFVDRDMTNPISISIETLLQSAIPTSAVGSRNSIKLFVSLCRNKWDTVMYYLQHVDRISVDFDFGRTDIREFIECISDDRYVLRIKELHDSDMIQLCETDKIYDADPILRGKVVCITGEFIVGNHSDVSGILSSYGAKVTSELDDNVNVVIVGDTQENIDGVMINAAKKSNISVISESEFFKHFEIDKDIEENLLLKQ